VIDVSFLPAPAPLANDLQLLFGEVSCPVGHPGGGEIHARLAPRKFVYTRPARTTSVTSNKGKASPSSATPGRAHRGKPSSCPPLLRRTSSGLDTSFAAILERKPARLFLTPWLFEILPRHIVLFANGFTVGISPRNPRTRSILGPSMSPVAEISQYLPAVKPTTTLQRQLESSFSASRVSRKTPTAPPKQIDYFVYSNGNRE